MDRLGFVDIRYVNGKKPTHISTEVAGENLKNKYLEFHLPYDSKTGYVGFLDLDGDNQWDSTEPVSVAFRNGTLKKGIYTSNDVEIEEKGAISRNDWRPILATTSRTRHEEINDKTDEVLNSEDRSLTEQETQAGLAWTKTILRKYSNLPVTSK